jgi:hypothetical protein
MSALARHIVTNSQEKEKQKETNKDLKQVIESQTKDKTRSHETARFDPLRQGQRLNTTEIKCSKLPTPQGEAKGLDTIGKRAKHKANSGDTQSSQSMNASWTLNKCMQTQVLPLN